MAGIYIHIPFCRKACYYCNFHFSTNHERLPQMLTAIAKEVVLRKDYLTETIHTIYFGGGTPSLVNEDYLSALMKTLRETFVVSTDAEITLEANPDDITEASLMVWKALGINRLSIGVQSFVEDDLRWMNRAHNTQQSLQSILLAQQHGFNNITIDLIYGTPALTDEQWQYNVQKAIDLNVAHLSCYALTVEPKTALDTMIKQQKIADVDADKQARHFELLMQLTKEAGYEHYEISNFAKPGHRSKHNSSYWQGKTYLGLGPSAHSFNGKSRQWNIANNALYINSIDKNEVSFEIEILTETQQINEYIMTSLRTIEGLSLVHIKQIWGEEKAKEILTASQEFFANGTMQLNNHYLQLTTKGKFLADGIAAELFFE